MIVCGIDPSLTNTGIAVLTHGQPTLITNTGIGGHDGADQLDENGFVIDHDNDPEPPDDQPAAHHDPQAIADCPLCNPDGYTTANRICDHIDRTETTARGRALVQAELDAIRRRKADRARGAR